MKRLLLVTIISLLSKCIFCQEINSEDRIYDFINNVILNNPTIEIIISKDGSTRALLTNKDSIDFDPYHCLFIDEKYRTQDFWDILLTNDDYKYLIDESKKLSSFEWDKERLSYDVVLFSKCQIRHYSKGITKSFNKSNKSGTKKPIPEIMSIKTFSAPIFNKKGDIAIIYSAEYSGPLSGFWSIQLYSKINGVWKLIGTDMKGMS